MSKTTRKGTKDTGQVPETGKAPGPLKPKAAAKMPRTGDAGKSNAYNKTKVTAPAIAQIPHKTDTSAAAAAEVTPITLQNPPADMELHHPQLHHKPKPFKEYLLESLMIFIAVMMGFIAENVRQGIQNSDHAHQLVVQLVQDMKADTAELNRDYQGELDVSHYNDSLFMLLQQPVANINVKKLVSLAEGSDSNWLFHPSGGAIQAIKNELQLSQFSNSKIISYIATYERDFDLFHTIQGISLQYQQRYVEPFMFAHFTPNDLDAALNGKHLPDATARNLTQADLAQLATEFAMIKKNNGEILNLIKGLKQDATDLLKYVTTQFKLDTD